MDKDEAIRLLQRELDVLRQQPYADLVRRIELGSVAIERSGARSAQYQLEITVLWDSRPGGDVLVMGSIDDGGWRAFAPLTRSFIKAADESFVGEQRGHDRV